MQRRFAGGGPVCRQPVPEWRCVHPGPASQTAARRRTPASAVPVLVRMPPRIPRGKLRRRGGCALRVATDHQGRLRHQPTVLWRSSRAACCCPRRLRSRCVRSRRGQQRRGERRRGALAAGGPAADGPELLGHPRHRGVLNVHADGLRNGGPQLGECSNGRLGLSPG